MKVLVRILLAADIILALIAGPFIVAGGGFGSGAGGSSFSRRTNIASSADQQTLALNLVNAICKNEGNDFPKTVADIVALTKKRTDAAWCKTAKEDGIAFYGGIKEAQNELKLLFEDKWDTRVLYAIDYLYQKRFSATSGGYNMICSGEGKFAPSMTIAIDPITDEDDNKKISKNDLAKSAHERGQAFDVLTYGCTTIKVEGKVKSIIPNQIGAASMSEDKAIASIAQAIGQSPEELKADLAASEAQTVVLAAKNSVVAVDPSVTAATGTLTAQTPNGSVAGEMARVSAKSQSGDAADLSQGGPSSNPRPTIQAALAQMQAGVPVGTYDEGAKPEAVGTKTLEQRLGVSLNDPAKIAKAVGASAQALGISQEAYHALLNKQYQQAARLEGASQINADLRLGLSQAEIATLAKANTTSAELLARSLLLQKLPTERAKTALALFQGGSQAVDQQLDALDAARKSEKPMQLAQALYDSGRLAQTQITTLRDFLNGDQVGKDGATRRFEQSGASSQVLSWMKASQNLSAEEQKAALAVLDQATKTTDMKANLAGTVASVKGLALQEFYAALTPVEKETFSKTLGKTSPTIDELEAAAKDGSLQRAVQAAALAKQLEDSGMVTGDAAYVASGIFAKDPSAQGVALGFFNKKNGTNFTIADFKMTTTPGGNQEPPKAAVYYAQNLLSQKTGLTISQVQTAIDKQDPAVLGQIAQKLAPNLKLPQGLIESVLKSDTKAEAKEGVVLKDKQIAKSVEGTDKQKKDFQDQLDEQMDKGINKGEELARQKAASLLAAKGVSPEDAKHMSEGKLKNSEDYLIAAAISQKGILTYGQAKNLLDGATQAEQYQASDSLLNYALRDQNINLQVSSGFTETMLKGPADQREQQMTQVGASYFAPELVQLAAKDNIVISNDQAKQILQNHDWETLRTTGESVGMATAADKISGQTGVPSGAILTIANNLKASGGDLGKIDMESAGWDIGQSLTGISKDSVLNIEQNFAAVKNNLVTQYSNMPGQMLEMGGNIGAGIVVGTLVGGQLAKIDPTGGLLTSYAMNYATKYLMSLGIAAPYLLAAGLIINPEATIASLKAMITQAFQIFTDPAGFVVGILGQLGFGGKKPFTGVILGNAEAAAKDVFTQELIKSTGAAAALNKDPGGTDDNKKSQDSQNQTGANTNQAANNPAVQGQATTSQNATYSLSPYLKSVGKPTPQYLQAVAKRSLDQVIEDLTVFGVVTSPRYASQTDLQDKHWKAFMGTIKNPTNEMAAKQILSPQIITLPSNAQTACKVDSDELKNLKKEGVKILYEGESSSEPPLGTDLLTSLSQLVYGNSFYPICSWGRVQGLLYDKAVSAVHFGV